jgi:hypothetical protein
LLVEFLIAPVNIKKESWIRGKVFKISVGAVLSLSFVALIKPYLNLGKVYFINTSPKTYFLTFIQAIISL